MGEEIITYQVLAFEDHCGLWLKIPAIDVQCLTGDLAVGLDVLDEASRNQATSRPERVATYGNRSTGMYDRWTRTSTALPSGSLMRNVTLRSWPRNMLTKSRE